MSTITPISDRDAAKLLDVSYDTIRNAVRRGDLTRVQTAGIIQHVVEEQVQLFKGKKRISKSLLSLEEHATWEAIRTSQTDNKTAPLPEVALGAMGFDQGREFIRAFMRGMSTELAQELAESIQKKNCSVSPSNSYAL